MWNLKHIDYFLLSHSNMDASEPEWIDPRVFHISPSRPAPIKDLQRILLSKKVNFQTLCVSFCKVFPWKRPRGQICPDFLFRWCWAEMYCFRLKVTPWVVKMMTMIMIEMMRRVMMVTMLWCSRLNASTLMAPLRAPALHFLKYIWHIIQHESITESEHQIFTASAHIQLLENGIPTPHLDFFLHVIHQNTSKYITLHPNKYKYPRSFLAFGWCDWDP